MPKYVVTASLVVEMEEHTAHFFRGDDAELFDAIILAADKSVLKIEPAPDDAKVDAKWSD